MCYGAPTGAQRQRVRLGEEEQGSARSFRRPGGNGAERTLRRRGGFSSLFGRSKRDARVLSQEIWQSLGPLPSSAPVYALGHLPQRGRLAGGSGTRPYKGGGRQRLSPHRSADGHQAPFSVGAVAPSGRNAGRQQEGAQMCPATERRSGLIQGPSGRPRKPGVRGGGVEDAGGKAAQIRLPPAPGGFFVPFWSVKKGHPRPP